MSPSRCLVGALALALLSATAAADVVAPILAGAWIGQMYVTSDQVPAEFYGKWKLLSTFQPGGAIMNLVQRKGEDEQMMNDGHITSMTYDSASSTAEVHEIQTRPDQPGELDVCETYSFRVGKHGRVHATFLGAYSKKCPTTEAEADWHGRMDKIDLSSPEAFLNVFSEDKGSM